MGVSVRPVPLRFPSPRSDAGLSPPPGWRSAHFHRSLIQSASDGGGWDASSALQFLSGLVPSDGAGLRAFVFSSSGDHGAEVYAVKPQAPATFSRLFDSLGLPEGVRAVLWAPVLHVPAERHLIRLRSSGALSVFFKIDLTVAALAAICEPLQLTALVGPAFSISCALDRDLCGFALEVARTGEPRLRGIGCRLRVLQGSMRSWRSGSLWDAVQGKYLQPGR